MDEDASGKKRPRSREEGSGEDPPESRKRAAKPKTKPSAGTSGSGSKAGKLKKAPKAASKAASKSASKDERGQKKAAASDQLNFPEKLMQLINENRAPNHVTWIESEEAIAFKTDKFQEEVLDKFFQGLKYDSFVRKLNRWGFRRVTSEGIAAGTVAYYHNSFRKEEQELLKTMGIGKKNDPEVRDLQAFGGESSMIGSASAAISREAQSRNEAANAAAASAHTARAQLDQHPRSFFDAAMSRQQSLEDQITTAVARLPVYGSQETKLDVPDNVLPQAGPSSDLQQQLLEAILSRQREADTAASREREAAALVENILLQQAQQQRAQQQHSIATALSSALANARDGDIVRQLAALAANATSRQPQQQQPPPAQNQFSPPQQPLQFSDLASNPAMALLLQQRLQGSNQGVNQNLRTGANPFAPNLNPLANLAANVNPPQGMNLNPNMQGNLNPLASLIANGNIITNNQGSQELESLLRSLVQQSRPRDAQPREEEKGPDQEPPNP